MKPLPFTQDEIDKAIRYLLGGPTKVPPGSSRPELLKQAALRAFMGEHIGPEVKMVRAAIRQLDTYGEMRFAHSEES